ACIFIYLVFFFSSRRRHTRFSRDWSSDVCSSDLGEVSIRPARSDLDDLRRADRADLSSLRILKLELRTGRSRNERQVEVAAASRAQRQRRSDGSHFDLEVLVAEADGTADRVGQRDVPREHRETRTCGDVNGGPRRHVSILSFVADVVTQVTWP